MNAPYSEMEGIAHPIGMDGGEWAQIGSFAPVRAMKPKTNWTGLGVYERLCELFP